jgi:hypothetical protein
MVAKTTFAPQDDTFAFNGIGMATVESDSFKRGVLAQKYVPSQAVMVLFWRFGVHKGVHALHRFDLQGDSSNSSSNNLRNATQE